MHALAQVPLPPAALAAAVAALFTLLLALLLSTARDVQRLRENCAEFERAAAARMREQQAAIQALKAELGELQNPAYLAPAGQGGGMNLTRRSQALRMHRAGDSPERIAATLGMSRTEIDLLLKVQRTFAARP
jgi:DNA-binding NarL/FixJ family response regulator